MKDGAHARWEKQLRAFRAAAEAFRCASASRFMIWAPMLGRDAWRTISPEDYRFAFERFGGSFAVHPRVVALVATLAGRPVRYAGLTRKGELLAAVPLWGDHILATKLALEFHGAEHLIDVGDSEVVLPVAENVWVNIPFKANMVSSLHADTIVNVECESAFAMTLAKGVRIGDRRFSANSRSERRRETRRFQEVGGRFLPVKDFSAKETAAIYTRLFEKRWSFSPLGKHLLPTVLQEIRDMLGGEVLLVGDRPVAIELVYKSETPRWLLANGVNRGVDPEFRNHSPGSILLFRNIERFEEEASVKSKMLRFSFGLNDADYKGQWSFETPAYRLDPQQQKWSDLLSFDGLTAFLHKARGPSG